MAVLISISSEGTEVPVQVTSLASCVVMHVKHDVHIYDLDSFLRGKPQTRCKQTKLNSVRTKQYKYCYCVCGCSYKMNLMHEIDMVMATESIVPSNHDHSADVKIGKNIHITSEVLVLSDTLARQNLFMPNYGALMVSILKIYL
jgi:hypothetical protein